MPQRVAVLLSGCGGLDGSDIYEAVLTLLALERVGAEAVCAAPNIPQYHVLNHLDQVEVEEQRNVLVESARIARGDIYDLMNLHAGQLDALIIPGGFGAVKNLSDFALIGPDAQADPQVERILKALLAAGKPMGAIGIAAATLVKALGLHGIDVTSGNDPGTAAAIETMGGHHKIRDTGQIHVDNAHKIVTTPACPGRHGIKAAAMGIDLLVDKVLELIK